MESRAFLPIEPERGLTLEKFFPSDSLAGMRSLLESLPVLVPMLQGLVELRLVIDANIVQQELRWRSATRRNVNARSGLQESLDAGVVVALAPEFLKSEIEDHLQDIAADTGVSVEKVAEHWRDFQSQLHFYEPRDSKPHAGSEVDPDDVVYVKTREELGAHAVYSRDLDLPKMNAPVISISLDLTLRRHARASSVVLGVTLGSGLTLMVGAGTLVGAYRLVEKGAKGIRGLPAWAQWSVAACAVGVLAHPKTRRKLKELWSEALSVAGELKPRVWATLGEIIIEFCRAQQTAAETYKEIQGALPKSGRSTTVQRARLICLVSGEPLSIREIERRMLQQGHRTRSRDFARYLRRVLRESGQFVESGPDQWLLQAA
jgi:hypothetical protein